MTIACLDTNVFQWGILNKASSSTLQEHVDKAREFVSWLRPQNYQLMLPTFVLSELLVAVDPADHANVLSELRKGWIIADFNAKAAVKLAQIRRDDLIKQARAERKALGLGEIRGKIIGDACIIATAIAHGADVIYTYDEGFQKLATHFIPCHYVKDMTF